MDATTHPLLLARLKHNTQYRETTYHGLGYATDDSYPLCRYELLHDAIEFLLLSDLVDLDNETLVLTPEGENALQAATIEDVFGGADNTAVGSSPVCGGAGATRELWVSLLVYGGVKVWFNVDGVEHEFQSVVELTHLITCGVNETESTTPTLGSWESFAGTFVEEHDQHEGVRAKFTCRCGDVEELEVRWGGAALGDVLAMPPVFKSAA